MGVSASPINGSVGSPFKIPFKAPGYAGGIIGLPGSGSGDSIPAMLSNGEYVVQSDAVSKYGVNFILSIIVSVFNSYIPFFVFLNPSLIECNSEKVKI